jgi:hypothetical protein
LLIHRLTTAKKDPAESPHMRMPVNASSGAKLAAGVELQPANNGQTGGATRGRTR